MGDALREVESHHAGVMYAQSPQRALGPTTYEGTAFALGLILGVIHFRATLFGTTLRRKVVRCSR
jgi:hypothetical protein